MRLPIIHTLTLFLHVRTELAHVEERHREKLQIIEEGRLTVEHHHVRGKIVTDDDLRRLENCRYMNG